MNRLNRRIFMELTGKTALAGLCAGPFLAVLLSGCRATELASMATGIFDSERTQSAVRAGTAMRKGFEDITNEEEYYIGRTVGAVILSSYKPLENERADAYVNLIGSVVSLGSDMPETFGGYHFLVLDSDEINAFAAPGGLIFVTRGMLGCCASEEALAAVLAHEVGHIQHRHGIQTIRRSRLTSAFSILAAEGARTLGGRELAQLTDIFEESVSDVVSTLVTSGYSRRAEREADRAAVTIMDRVGYDSYALVEMLEVMETRIRPGGLDFAKTHPAPADRIKDVRPSLPGSRPAVPAARETRFSRIMQNV